MARPARRRRAPGRIPRRRRRLRRPRTMDPPAGWSRVPPAAPARHGASAEAMGRPTGRANRPGSRCESAPGRRTGAAAWVRAAEPAGRSCGRHPLSTWGGGALPPPPASPPPMMIRRLLRWPPLRSPAPYPPPSQALTAARRACSVRSAAGGPLPPSRAATRQGRAGRSLTRRGRRADRAASRAPAVSGPGGGSEWPRRRR
jgi:hypothetical protein